MHPTKHLSTHLTLSFSGVTDVFTVNDTYITWVCPPDKEAQWRRAENSTDVQGVEHLTPQTHS